MDCDWADTAKERRENLPESTLSQALSEAEEQAAAVSQAGSAVAVGSGAAGESGDDAGGRKPFAKQPSCIAEEGKRVGSVRFSLGLAFSSLQMRFGARGLRGVLMRRMDRERHRRGRRAPAFRLFRSHYCDRTVSRSGKRPHRHTVQHPLVLVLYRRGLNTGASPKL